MAVPVIDGFEFRSKIGAGGYADVYLFEQQWPKRPVAVKVLRDNTVSDPKSLFNEANIVASLRHPNIIDIYHSGTAGGHSYLVMPFYSAPSLSERLRGGALSYPEVLALGIQMAGALETAHHNGVVHRDVKPANVLYDDFGRPYLADFGIASHLKDLASADDSMSLLWAPPEIVSGKGEASALSDVYSLAATIWHAATGHPPHRAATEKLTADQYTERILGGIIPSSTGMSPFLELLLRRALSTNPQARPKSAAELAFALQEMEQRDRLPQTAVVVPSVASQVHVTAGRSAVPVQDNPALSMTGLAPMRSAEVERGSGPGSKARQAPKFGPGVAPSVVPAVAPGVAPGVVEEAEVESGSLTAFDSGSSRMATEQLTGPSPFSVSDEAQVGSSGSRTGNPILAARAGSPAKTEPAVLAMPVAQLAKSTGPSRPKTPVAPMPKKSAPPQAKPPVVSLPKPIGSAAAEATRLQAPVAKTMLREAAPGIAAGSDATRMAPSPGVTVVKPSATVETASSSRWVQSLALPAGAIFLFALITMNTELLPGWLWAWLSGVQLGVADSYLVSPVIPLAVAFLAVGVWRGVLVRDSKDWLLIPLCYLAVVLAAILVGGYHKAYSEFWHLALIFAGKPSPTLYFQLYWGAMPLPPTLTLAAGMGAGRLASSAGSQTR